MVLVDGRQGSAAVVREACRLARAAGAAWLGVHPDASRRLFYSRAEEERLSASLGLVEGLGGDLAPLPPSGQPVSRMLLAAARARGVTDVVLARPARPAWVERLAGPRLEDLAPPWCWWAWPPGRATWCSATWAWPT